MRGGLLVVVVDSRAAERDQIAAALQSHYPVRAFGDLSEARARLGEHRPTALVIDEKVRPIGAANAVSSARAMFPGTPIIFCISAASRSEGAEAVLVKPFRRSQLLNTISALTNKQVEERWAALPSPHPQTLRRTLETFNGISDLIETGQPLAYDQVVDTCSPVVDAVTNSQYRVLLANVRGHDNLTYVHSVRMATLLALFGHTIGLREDALLILATGGLLHDLGKMSMPQELLNKPGALTAAEMARIRQHVPLTVEYLRDHSDVPKGVLTIAGQHHERMDGTGYPAGLAGDKLNDLARMSAIVDVFSALTEYRTSRAARSAESALAVMTSEMALGLDQRLLNLFRGMLLDAGGSEWAA